MQEQKHKRLTTKRDQTQLHGCPYVNNLGVGRGGGCSGLLSDSGYVKQKRNEVQNRK